MKFYNFNSFIPFLQEVIIPAAVAKNTQSTLLKDVITLLLKLPTISFQELSIHFLEPLKLLNTSEDFPLSISKLNDCELKRVLQEQL